MADCIFCKIAAGEIPSKKAYEDDQILAFYDLDPQAPVHILIIPKEHIFAAAANLAKELGLEKGYRIVNNCGEDGGQTVRHLHFHLLGGRSMEWPPG